MSLLFTIGSLFGAVLVAAVIQWLHLLWTLPSGPPVPPSIPVLGNMWMIDKSDPLGSMSKAAFKYGDHGVMRWLSGIKKPFWIIYSSEYLAALFENSVDPLVGKVASTLSLNQYTGGCKDIVMSSGEYWKKARKMFVRGVMVSVDRSVPLIEKVLKESIQRMITESENFTRPVLVSEVFREQTFRVIAEFATGRCKIEPEFMKEFISINSKLDAYLNPERLRNMIPGYEYLPFEDEFAKLLKRRNFLLSSLIEEHKKTIDPNNPVDFLDAILLNNDHGVQTVDVLYVLLDTYLGGTDTSSSTMEYFAGLMAEYPEVQRKVHEEIDAVVGKRDPTIEDEEKLPFLAATLKEVMRFYPVGNFVRSPEVDIQLGKYTIPKGSRVLILNNALARNPELWDNPDDFLPERFLTEKDGGVKLRGPEFPKNRDEIKMSFFGLGRRGCPGYPLAKRELFLQTVYYMQAFEFSKPSSKPLNLEMMFGLVGRPRGPINLMLKYRL
eukprot:TRINITY_DN6295_c0_g3_i1.p1 TRINITY_DN6295_c0_g3~~TRINITY_DN6295_c0_g3_i1.p1  ORF type:complete len:495 (+),score=126.79 TRINITY_DN6295_c0_g3_i1:1142-2626(+)